MGRGQEKPPRSQRVPPLPPPSLRVPAAGGILTTMLEGEPGTLEPREELTLPGEVSGCWGE